MRGRFRRQIIMAVGGVNQQRDPAAPVNSSSHRLVNEFFISSAPNSMIKESWPLLDWIVWIFQICFAAKSLRTAWTAGEPVIFAGGLAPALSRASTVAA